MTDINIPNKSLAAFLVDDRVRAVTCIYDPDDHMKSQKTYMFKTMDESIQPDDLVVVPTESRVGFTVCKVVQVDIEPDFESRIDYKWIAGKVDKEAYDLLLKNEAFLINKLREGERSRARKALRKSLEETVGSDTLKQIEMHVSGGAATMSDEPPATNDEPSAE